jgi:ATP-dependent DNA ligase
MTVREAMKYEEAGGERIDALLADPNWVAEQKMDGTRGLVVIGPKGIWWPGRGGRGALAHTAATQHLPAINAVLRRATEGLGDDFELVLDGEIMTHTGQYRLFDLPYLRVGEQQMILPGHPFSQRRTTLETFMRAVGDSRVELIRQASTTQDKVALLEAVRAIGAEGIVLKNLDGRYEPGRRVRHQLKFKLVKTVDVVVLTRRASPNSIQFGVYDGGAEPRLVGGCSMIGKEEVQPGDVVEVAYLYFTGSSVYQPRMVRRRFDKMPRDCTMDQLGAYSRAVV